MLAAYSVVNIKGKCLTAIKGMALLIYLFHWYDGYCFAWTQTLYLAIYQCILTKVTDDKLLYIFNSTFYKKIVWRECDCNRLITLSHYLKNPLFVGFRHTYFYLLILVMGQVFWKLHNVNITPWQNILIHFEKPGLFFT